MICTSMLFWGLQESRRDFNPLQGSGLCIGPVGDLSADDIISLQSWKKKESTRTELILADDLCNAVITERMI